MENKPINPKKRLYSSVDHMEHADNMNKNDGKSTCSTIEICKKIKDKGQKIIINPGIEDVRPPIPGNYQTCNNCGRETTWLDYIHPRCQFTQFIQKCRMCSKCIEELRKASENNCVICPFCNQDTINVKATAKLDGEFAIFITSGFTMANICVYVKSNTTFAELRAKVACYLGYPIGFLSGFCYDNKIMLDTTTMGEIGIRQGSSLRTRLCPLEPIQY